MHIRHQKKEKKLGTCQDTDSATFHPTQKGISGKLFFLLTYSRSSLNPWWYINVGHIHGLKVGEDEVIGWKLFYTSRIANNKYERETDRFCRNETSFVWLVHVIKQELQSVLATLFGLFWTFGTFIPCTEIGEKSFSF